MEGWRRRLELGERLVQEETAVKGPGGADASSPWAPRAVYSKNLPRLFAFSPES